jgi:hypothetical protein
MAEPMLIGRMARGDVAALVAHDGRELCLGVQVREDPSRDEHRPARQREGVHRRIVDDVELPRQVLALRGLREPLPQVAHEGFQLVVAIEADRLLRLQGSLLADLHLLALGEQIELQLAGGGVAEAGCGQTEQGERQSAHGPRHTRTRRSSATARRGTC